MQTKDLVQENIQKIGELFPNCVTETVSAEGKVTHAIDFEALRRQLSGDIISGEKERYVFTWPGKSEAQNLANAQTNTTLRPVREESSNFDNTRNVYIKGDNLDSLKLLRETYLGKIKVIYIDPPYNTGNDFVYKDDFSISDEDYQCISGDYDHLGNHLVVNSSSDGKYHTNWLNMIYPRLILAKDFLKDDGVIFISIDDNEQANLKKICDEIFGSGNFIATIPWRKRTAKSDVPFGISQDYEWIVAYAKSDSYVASIEGKGRKYYETPDLPGRPWRYHDLTKQTTASERPNSYFTIVDPKNGKEYPADKNNTWRITSDTIEDYLSANRIIFPGDYDFLRISKPVLRYFKEDDMKKAGASFGEIAVSTKLPDEIGLNKDGTSEIARLFENKVFSFSKPSSLIKYLVRISTKNDPDATVMDFFSGSGTTADAVIQLNEEDGGTRSFILVQVPESCPDKSEAQAAGFETICDIGMERIRRAGANHQGVDVGFRVLKLDSSNMNKVFYDPKAVKKDILDYAVENIKTDRSGEDLLFQVMLELGIELSATIDRRYICGKMVFNVDSGYLIACFDDNVTDEVITEIANTHPRYAVFRDSSMDNDSVAINLEQLFKAYSPNTKVRVL